MPPREIERFYSHRVMWKRSSNSRMLQVRQIYHPDPIQMAEEQTIV